VFKDVKKLSFHPDLYQIQSCREGVECSAKTIPGMDEARKAVFSFLLGFFLSQFLLVLLACIY